MNIGSTTPDALKTLPKTISMAGKPSTSVYYGTPLEMVRQMAAEMGPGISVREAVSALITSLGFKRGILIAIPEDMPEDILAGLFIHALLSAGVGKPAG